MSTSDRIAYLGNLSLQAKYSTIECKLAMITPNAVANTMCIIHYVSSMCSQNADALCSTLSLVTSLNLHLRNAASLLHLGQLLDLGGRDDDAVLLVGEILQVEQVLGPAVVDLADLVQIHLAGLAGAAGQDLGLAAGVLLLQLGVGDPDDAHAGAPASLHAGHAVLEDEALLGGDGRLARGQAVVDGAQREQVDVGQRLAAAGRDAPVVAEHAALRLEDGEQLAQVRRLEAEVGLVRRRGQRNVHALRGALLRLALRRGLGVPVPRATEVAEQLGHAGQSLGGGEVLALQLAQLRDVFLTRDGQLGPVVEDLVGGGTGPALQLRLDGPGKRGAIILLEHEIHAEGVDIFGIEQEAIHVEETGPNGRETGKRRPRLALLFSRMCEQAPASGSH